MQIPADLVERETLPRTDIGAQAVGLRLRQPIGGEFGFGPELARDFLDGTAFGGNVWETDIARFGIDIYMTTTALVRRKRIAQAFLGAKIHDPKDPGADLAPMFTQVVGTLLVEVRPSARLTRVRVGTRDLSRTTRRWRPVVPPDEIARAPVQ